MIGRLTPHGRAPLELPKKDCVIAILGDEFVVTTPDQTGIFTLKWDPYQLAWLVVSGPPDTLLNGDSIVGHGLLSETGKTLSTQGLSFHFEREIAAPLLQGTPFKEIDLNSNEIYSIGRRSDSAEGGVQRIDLDADARSLSSKHCRLHYQNSRWTLEDTSRSGTELNGSLFADQKNLVYGDRIQIGPYRFEFLDNRLRRIDNSLLTRITTRGLGTQVKHRKTGKKFFILKDVSLDIEPGKFVGILGGSGQGKSTLLNALCGISPGNRGSVTIGGIPVEELVKREPDKIGFVPQDDIVHRELTINQALNAAARIRVPSSPKGRAELISQTIKDLQLEPFREQRIDTLSGGQRKRVSIAIELLSKPDLLFLDEPSSGLDPYTESKLMELLQSLASTGLAVICTTHVLQKAYLFDHFLFIHEARLIFSGNTDEARRRFLDDGSSESQESPLELIYPAVLGNENKSGEEWAQEFESQRSVLPPTTQPPPQEKVSSQRVGPLTKWFALMRRQWQILLADPLNIAFLALQVCVIGLIVGWLSDDLGFRMFLGIIAAMWFGCSNGAQQIVGELPIFFRERVCGLGNLTYISSKICFQGFISITQALLLFAIIVISGNIFHSPDWDQKKFEIELDESLNPIVADFSDAEDSGLFTAVGDTEVTSEPAAEPDKDTKAQGPPPRRKAAMVGLLGKFAHWFNLKINILNAGPTALTYRDNSPILDANKRQKVAEGIGSWKVVWISIFLKVSAFVLAAFVGVVIGLMVSSLVQTTTQAVMWVPLLLIPQILFGGFVVPFIDMSESRRAVARIFPSFAAQRLIDVSHLYGRRMPLLTNETRNPVFLTPDGEKETVSWTTPNGRDVTETYQKVSDVNRSWQNLATSFENIGERKRDKERRFGSTSYTYPSTTGARDDVKYRHGTLYRYLTPAWLALMLLAGWCALSFTITLLKLRQRK